ncbi:MAG: hypothetical protein ABI091_16300 [Ferruginibacter sp.]
MKYSKYGPFIIVAAFILFLSCNSNKNTSVTTGKISSAESTTVNSTGDASFYCRIDGRDFSGKGNANNLSAFRTGNGIAHFDLADMDTKQQGIPEQLSFTIADHGTTTMHNSNSSDNGSYSSKYNPSDYIDAFGFNEVTVIVTSSNASGIKGTFSGTLFDPQNKKAIPVTDGKFDLPWSPYSKK